jgi:hypothetical protein
MFGFDLRGSSNVPSLFQSLVVIGCHFKAHIVMHVLRQFGEKRATSLHATSYGDQAAPAEVAKSRKS